METSTHALDNTAHLTSTARISAIDLWKSQNSDPTQLEIGDGVRICDPNLGINDYVRVVGMELYPYEPTDTIYTLGDPPRTELEILADTTETPDFTFNFDLFALKDAILELLPDFTHDGILPAYFTIQDSLETNFAAGLFLSAGPGHPGHDVEHDKRMFVRIVEQQAEYVEATLQEARLPYTEKPSWWDDEPEDWEETNPGEDWVPPDFVPETPEDIFTLFKYRGEQVYWVSLPANENTRMTLTDPVLFNPPEYPPHPENLPPGGNWPTQAVIDRVSDEHRFAHAVKLRKVIDEKITDTITRTNSTLEILRYVYPSDEHGSTTAEEPKMLGIRLNDVAHTHNLRTSTIAMQTNGLIVGLPVFGSLMFFQCI